MTYEIEPGIAPLVQAVQSAGFDTFSSCEGHADGRRPPSCGSVGFLANETRALEVHQALVDLRPQLRCSWVLRANFLAPRGQWALAWTLENHGLVEDSGGDEDNFIAATVLASQGHDLAHLTDMFLRLAARTR